MNIRLPVSKFYTEIIYVLINRGAIAVVAFITEIILSNYLTTGQKGEIFYIRNNIELLGLVFTFGMGMSIVYFRRKFGTIFDRQFLKFMLYAILSLILVGFALYPFPLIVKYLFINYQYYTYAIIAGVLFLISVFIQKFLLSDDNLKAHNFLIFFSKIAISLAFICIAFFAVKNKVLLMILAILGVYTVVDIIFFFKTKLDFHSKYKNPQLYKYSFNSYFYELVFQFKTKTDNFVVLYFFNTSILGVFSVAKNFSAILLILATSISLILFKEVSTGNIDFNRFKKMLRRYNGLLLIMGVVAIGFNYIIVSYFINESFHNAVYYFIPIAISTVMFSISSFIQSYLNGIGRSSIQLKAVMFSLIPYLVFLFFKNIDIYFCLTVFLVSGLIQLIVYYSHILRPPEGKDNKVKIIL